MAVIYTYLKKKADATSTPKPKESGSGSIAPVVNTAISATAITAPLEDSKRTAELTKETELLAHVFNAAPEKVAAYLTTLPPSQKKVILTKSCYQEGYFSRQLNQFVCLRQWRHVSPLQAAALSLDNFLVLELLSHIKDDAVLRQQAAQQLQEILSRKEGEEQKEKAEADFDAYQAPFQDLLKAYKDFIAQYETLSSAKRWDELERLWARIGECHRRLPPYGLQEFFNDIPFDPVPSFTTAPKRGECRYWNGTLLDLDAIGLKTCYGLYKGGRLRGGFIVRERNIMCGMLSGPTTEVAAITRLCEYREAELKNIIDCLLKPEAVVTLRSTDKTATAITVKP